jgi:hypothetical protein
MRKTFTLIFLLVLFSVYSFGQVQILKPSNYKTTDNVYNLSAPSFYGDCWTLDKARAKFGDSAVYYYEYSARAGWFRGASSLAYGGDYRQTSELTGETINGNYATWLFDIDTSTSYLVYNYILSSGNAASNAYFKLNRFGESIAIDSVRFDLRENNDPSYGRPGVGVLKGVWVPISIVDLYRLPKGFSISIGADTLTGFSLIRADAIRILKSDVDGPDLEFGKRPFSFDSARVEESFGDVGLGVTLEKSIKVYNLGNKELVINGFDFVLNTGRFTNSTILPLKIAPGGKSEIKIAFRPYQEEFAVDTLIVKSNDPMEPQAKLPVSGKGINYYFILNGSDPNSAEPNYNAPYNNPNDPNHPKYTEGVSDPSGSWMNSGSVSPFPFPIVGGNKYSRVTTSVGINVWCNYNFTLEPDKFGTYIMEYSGPYYSSNATSNAAIIVKTPFIQDSMTAIFSEESLQLDGFWRQLGTTWSLNGGMPTNIQFYNANRSDEYLRADLLRIRKIPSKPTISAEYYGPNTYYYGSISVYPAVRAQNPLTNKHTFKINSNGESMIRIDSIYLRRGWDYKILDKLNFPIELPAVNGQLSITVEFDPTVIFSGIVDTLIIKSNADNYPVLFTRFYGSGIGDVITADDADEVTYCYPPTPIDYNLATDPANAGKWFFITGSGTNNRRLLGQIYYMKGDAENTDLDKKNLSFVEWYPAFPLKQGVATAEPDSFDVYAVLPAGSSISSPAAKYVIYEYGGKPTVKIISQNAYDATLNPTGVPTSGEVNLGRYQFLRGGKDSHGNGAIYGHVELWNDTSLVTEYYKNTYPNPAKKDTHFVRADAIIFRQAAPPGTLYVVEPEVPTKYELSQNYPNPFNPTTNIRFSLVNFGKVSIKVYDMLGREVRTIINDNMKPGNYTIEWNGKNNFGHSVSSGTYFYRIITNKFIQTKKMLLMK